MTRIPVDSCRLRNDATRSAPLAHRTWDEGPRVAVGGLRFSMTPSIAMKVYDYQWSATYGMEPAVAADELVRDGVDTALIRNQIDPLPGSGVDQAAYLAPVSRSRLRPIGHGRTPCEPPDCASIRPRRSSSIRTCCTRSQTRDPSMPTATSTGGSIGTWVFARRTRAIWLPRLSDCGVSRPS